MILALQHERRRWLLPMLRSQVVALSWPSTSEAVKTDKLFNQRYQSENTRIMVPISEQNYGFFKCLIPKTFLSVPYILSFGTI
jgi:hypothetical protein